MPHDDKMTNVARPDFYHKEGGVSVSDLVGIAPGFKTERQETEDRIAELQSRVTRLQRAARVGRNVVARNFIEEFGYESYDAFRCADEHLRLHPGDLDPVKGGE